ncbi:unnamed protein product [Dovyalis caffra]|uniref:Uncharacterized protein n=1 Tax=Dovyalis caffra TaxID=77055 RepID=A0AAV1SH91_9ROSI|nr:unnamed protein product [Dovyalis caffra]
MSVQLIVSPTQAHANGKKEVRNVQIESNGGQNILIIREALNRVVGVINNISTENQSTNSTINCRLMLSQMGRTPA